MNHPEAGGLTRSHANILLNKCETDRDVGPQTGRGTMLMSISPGSEHSVSSRFVGCL